MRQRGQQRQVSFSELEWRAQGIGLEPSLQCLSDFLDRHGKLLELVAGDVKNHPKVTPRNHLETPPTWV